MLDKKESMEIRKTNRIEWVDMLKGLAIICVLLGHQVGATNGVVPYSVGLWIYSFHLPLFFFLSGYTLNVFKYNNFKDYIVKKIKTIVVPLMIFSLINIIFSYLYYGIILNNNKYKDVSLLEELIDIFFQCDSVLWFLPCLFVAELILYFIIKKSTSIKQIMIYTGIIFGTSILYNCLGGPKLPWEIIRACFFIIFIAIGYVAKNNDAKKINGKLNSVIFLLINILVAYLNHKVSNFYVDDNTIGNPFLYLISSVCAIFALVNIFSKIPSNKILLNIGMNSLIFYGLGDLMRFVPDILAYNILNIDIASFGNWGIIVMFVYVTIMCLCVAPCSYIINKRLKFITGKF